MSAADTTANGAAASTDAPYVSPHLPTLNELLPEALTRAQRRRDGIERPIPLRWPALAPHYGGGLWPGAHFICANTGIGKTTFGFQEAVHAAREGFPVAYIGLELRRDEAGMRLLGDHAAVPWSKLYTGQASPHDLELARAASLDLRAEHLPLHIIPRRAQGWPASKLATVAEEMRKQYPQPDGPGSLPMLLALDYLQIVGSELVDCGRCPACKKAKPCKSQVPESLDIRERIARAAYFAHDVAERFDAAVLIVSSVARERYNLWKLVEQASLAWRLDATGLPIERRILNPDALVGAGKESGEIEYGGDSVAVIARVPGTWTGGVGCEVVFATAKGRATGATWSPLRFTGWGYIESIDGGASIVGALKPDTDDDPAAQEEKKQDEIKREEQDRADRRDRKTESKLNELRTLMNEVVRVVEANPGVGKADLRNRVASTTGAGKDKIDPAIAGCEEAGRIVVIRRNERDHRHYPPDSAEEKREREKKLSPPHPPVGAQNAPHVGSGDGHTSATPVEPAIPHENKGERVAEASATPAISSEEGSSHG